MYHLSLCCGNQRQYQTCHNIGGEQRRECHIGIGNQDLEGVTSKDRRRFTILDMENGCGGHGSDGCRETAEQQRLAKRGFKWVALYKGLTIHNRWSRMMKGADTEELKFEDMSGMGLLLNVLYRIVDRRETACQMPDRNYSGISTTVFRIVGGMLGFRCRLR